MIEEGLRTFLIADSTIAALIGTRAYGVEVPQKPTYPLIVMTRTSAGRVPITEGASDLAEPGFQIDCYDNTLTGARTLAIAVRKRLNGYKGPAGSETIKGAFLINDQDLYESEIKANRVLMDFSIWHTEET